MKWIKKFWFDLGNLPKPEWFLKYVLPPLALFVTWGFAGHLYLSSISKEKLIPKTGIVNYIGIKLEKGYKRNKNYPLIISLVGERDRYRIMDKFKFKDYFHKIQKEVLPGDTISLYVRHNWQYLLSWGRRKDVLIIEKKGETIFPISAYRKDAKNLCIFLAFFSALLWIVYYLYKRKIILKKRFEYPVK